MSSEPVLAPLKQPTPPPKADLEPATAAAAAAARRAGGGTNGGKPEAKAVDEKKKKSVGDVLNRVIYSILLAYVFLAAMPVGGLFCLLVMFSVLLGIFLEVTRISQQARKEQKLLSVPLLKWYFFVVVATLLTLVGAREMLVDAMPALEAVYPVLPFATFAAVTTGIVVFVLTLRRGAYRYQFISFTWTVMTLIFCGAQYGMELRTLSRGIIWFLLPTSMVINNDIWAYMWGKMFGRTRLLALSPKKTLEGFLGAFLFTVLWAYWFSGFLSHFPFLYCPAHSFWPSRDTAHCVRDPLYVQTEVPLPPWVVQLTGGRLTTVMFAPVQRHAVVLAVFASLVAPFGGFLASGLKRAFKLKDFGNLIPGHGGITDRMDCQGTMGICTYFYLRACVFPSPRCPTVDQIALCALALSATDRQNLVAQLTASLGK